MLMRLEDITVVVLQDGAVTTAKLVSNENKGRTKIRLLQTH